MTKKKVFRIVDPPKVVHQCPERNKLLNYTPHEPSRMREVTGDKLSPLALTITFPSSDDVVKCYVCKHCGVLYMDPNDSEVRRK